MRLQIVDHLETMLDTSVEFICFRKIGQRVSCDMAGFSQLINSLDSPADAQLGIAPTPDQLLRLGIKLDFTNTAATELYVMAGDRNLRTAVMGINLPFNRLNILNGGKIQRSPPDERSKDI